MSLWQRFRAWLRSWRRQPQPPQQPAAAAQPAQAGQQQAQAAQAGGAVPGWLAQNVGSLFKTLLAVASLVAIAFCLGVLVMIGLSVIEGITNTAKGIGRWIQELPTARQPAPVTEPLVESLLPAGEVQAWMYRYLSDESSGWHQLKLVHQHHLSGREGWSPLPVNLSFMDGGYVVVRPLYGTESNGVDFSASISYQLQPGVELLSPHGGRAEIGADGGPLAVHLTPRWNLRGPFKLGFEVEVRPPKKQRLWIGQYCVLQAGEASYFGWLPFSIKGVPVDWTMQVHFLPKDTDGVLPFPHLRADYYTTRWHEVVLGVGDLWDRETWEKNSKEPTAAQALRYEQLRQDSWQISSSEIRDSCPESSLPDKAWFGCKVFEPLVVQVVVLFH